MNRDEHIELWNKLRQGSEEALYSLYKEFYRLLFYHGLKICKESEVIKECINQTFLYFWEKREGLSAAENVGSYIYSAFRRRLVLALQQEAKYNNLLEKTALPETLITPSHEQYLIEIQDREEMKKKVTAAVNRLSKRKQQLLKLHYYEGLSYEEIALKTGLSLRTIYNKLHEALKTLRQSLGQQYSSLPVWLLLIGCI